MFSIVHALCLLWTKYSLDKAHSNIHFLCLMPRYPVHLAQLSRRPNEHCPLIQQNNNLGFREPLSLPSFLPSNPFFKKLSLRQREVYKWLPGSLCILFLPHFGFVIHLHLQHLFSDWVPQKFISCLIVNFVQSLHQCRNLNLKVVSHMPVFFFVIWILLYSVCAG